jgi:hypothetical protein
MAKAAQTQSPQGRLLRRRESFSSSIDCLDCFYSVGFLWDDRKERSQHENKGSLDENPHATSISFWRMRTGVNDGHKPNGSLRNLSMSDICFFACTSSVGLPFWTCVRTELRTPTNCLSTSVYMYLHLKCESDQGQTCHKGFNLLPMSYIILHRSWVWVFSFSLP